MVGGEATKEIWILPKTQRYSLKKQKGGEDHRKKSIKAGGRIAGKTYRKTIILERSSGGTC